MSQQDKYHIAYGLLNYAKPDWSVIVMASALIRNL